MPRSNHANHRAIPYHLRHVRASADPRRRRTADYRARLAALVRRRSRALGQAPKDIPTLTMFYPPTDRATGAAIIVCPGGGYTHLAPHEGAPVSQWLNTLGITSAVLKYRLGSDGYHHPVEMEDIQRAIRIFRSNAQEWKIDPSRIGVLGFSAGGHLASTAATHFDDGDTSAADPIDRVGCRPDIALLIYPVIMMNSALAHSGSRKALLGDNPDPSLLDLLSNEKQVTAKTPPCFLVATADDATVPVQNSIEFALACKENKVPFELHIFEHGRHGFGLGGTDPALSTWPADAAVFLRHHKFAAAALTTAP